MAVALGVGEFISAIGTTKQSLVGSIGNIVIDDAGGTVTRTTINLVGSFDKPVLLVGIVTVALLIGCWLGSMSRTRRWIGPAGFALFALLGIWAAALDPLAGIALAIVAALSAVIAGSLTLIGLFHVAVTGHPMIKRQPKSATRKPDIPTDPHATRRAFFGYAGAAGAFAVTVGAIGRSIGTSATNDATRAQIQLPTPINRAASATDPDSMQTPGIPSFPIDGLSPYLVPNTDFYRIDTALIVPRVDIRTWKLSITGMVDEPFDLSYDDIMAMPQVEQAVTLSCVSNELGGGLVGNAIWQGIPLLDMLRRAGLQPGATQIVGRSIDGFTVGFPAAALNNDRIALIAVGMNGEPLPAKHGFPVRLVVAGLYGYVSATKWLTEIRCTTMDAFDGYWIPRGWAKEAPVKLQSRIDVPRAGARLTPGPCPIAGVAWAPGPGRGITKVEVQIDGGPWIEAQLGDVISDNTWREWVVYWDATRGDHAVTVRATDGTGETQTEDVADVIPDGATGWHTRRIRVMG